MRRKMTALAALLLAACVQARTGSAAQPGWNVSSPDQAIRVELAIRPVVANAGGSPLQYRVRRRSDVALDWSPLGLRYGETDFGPGLRVVSAHVEPYNDTYPLLHGKASQISVRANRLIVDTTSAAGMRMRLTFHVQNDGVGFRYEIPQQEALPASAKVTAEHTGFHIPNGARAWLQRETLPGSYEGGFAGRAGPATNPL